MIAFVVNDSFNDFYFYLSFLDCLQSIQTKKTGAVSEFWHPLQWCAKFYRGMTTINTQTYKQRADIWLTYCYISSSQVIRLSFLPKHCTNLLKFSFIKQIIIKLSLVWPKNIKLYKNRCFFFLKKGQIAQGGASYHSDFDRGFRHLETAPEERFYIRETIPFIRISPFDKSPSTCSWLSEILELRKG